MEIALLNRHGEDGAMALCYAKDRNHYFVDITWPDGIRTRKAVIDKKQGRQLNLKARASRIDGSWKQLRRRMFITLDLPEEMPPILGAKTLPIREFEIPQIPPCVYFLCLGDEIVYVGQSTTLARRIIDHSEDQKKLFDRVFYLQVPKAQLSGIEARFIDEFKPRMNRIGGLKQGGK